jgi:phosphonate utilization associated putative membrane protein
MLLTPYSLTHALTWPIVALVLFGALLHASWNALVKSSSDKSLDTALLHLMGGLVAIPLLWWSGWPAQASWPWLALSVLIHFAYYIALAGAYKHGDFSLTYPLMRGLAPLLVVLGSAWILGEQMAALLLAGVAAITLGVGLIGWDNPAALLRQKRAVWFALANALIISLYTVVDGKGVRASGSVLAYIAALTLLDAIFYPAFVAWQRARHTDSTEWLEMKHYVYRRWKIALIGGIASLASYGIALWAMTRAPVAAVAALRETSVLFAAVLGALLLKERFGLRRALGTLAIFLGIALLRLS